MLEEHLGSFWAPVQIPEAGRMAGLEVFISYSSYRCQSMYQTVLTLAGLRPAVTSVTRSDGSPLTLLSSDGRVALCRLSTWKRMRERARMLQPSTQH